MTPFEDLIKELGQIMDLPLHPDNRQACVLFFSQDELRIQIDLDTNADRILIGTQLGRLNPGSYRKKILFQALRVNGGSLQPRGILAFSEKNETLVLFQFFPIATLTAQKLAAYLELFREHAKAWKEALKRGEVPEVEEDSPSKGSGMFGLKS